MEFIELFRKLLVVKFVVWFEWVKFWWINKCWSGILICEKKVIGINVVSIICEIIIFSCSFIIYCFW